ncbi:Odorant receptor 36 [Ephemera danica]|nr:Odorant receptor 36 [Ephemera danica]
MGLDVFYPAWALDFFGLYGKPRYNWNTILTYTVLVSVLMLHTLLLLRVQFLEYTVVMTVFSICLSLIGTNFVFRFCFFVYKHTPHNECKQFDALYSDMRAQSSRTIRRFCRTYFTYTAFCSLLLVATQFISSFFYSERYRFDADNKYFYVDQWRPLLYEIWLPWGDPHEWPYYPYVLLWQEFVYLMQSCVNAVTDAFICSLMLAAAERGAFLARVAPRALLPGRDGEVTRMCRAWIRYHQHYLGILTMINKELGPLLLEIQLFGITKVMFNVFLGIVSGEIIAILAIADAGPLLINLLTFSIAGQKIINASNQLARVTVNAAEIARGGLQLVSLRNLLQVVRARCAATADGCITGLGYFKVSIAFFARVLSAGFTYVLVLNQLKSKK